MKTFFAAMQSVQIHFSPPHFCKLLFINGLRKNKQKQLTQIAFLIFFSFLFLLFKPCQAQTDNVCATATAPNVLNNTTATTASLLMDDEVLNMRIYVHIVRKNNRTGGRDFFALDNALDKLETAFQPHNIFFTLECVDYINSNTYYFADSDRDDVNDTADEVVINNLMQENTHSDGVDIYLMPLNSEVVSRTTGIPSTTLLLGGSGYLVEATSDGNTIFIDRLPDEIVHEMGHCLGLHHTHNGTCPDGNGTLEGLCRSDACSTLCSENPTDEVCTDCENNGDFVCDTRAEYPLTDTQGSTFVLDDGWCDQNDYVDSAPNFAVFACSGQLDEWDCDGIPFPSDSYDFEPNVRNYMSYAPPNCRNEFTCGQDDRMRMIIANASFDISACLINNDIPIAIADYNMTTPFQIIPENVTITENTPKWIDRDIVIPINTTYTVANTILTFQPNAGIVVKPGAKLILDNVILKAKECAGRWKGIQVEGDATIPHPSSGTDTDDHGVVIMQNSTIQNADVGIWAGQYGGSDDGGFTSVLTGGGLVRAMGNNTFLNNKIDISFSNTPEGFINKSHITNNTFTVDENYLGDEAIKLSLAITQDGNMSIAYNTFNITGTPPSTLTDIQYILTRQAEDILILYNDFSIDASTGATVTGIDSDRSTLFIEDNNFNCTTACSLYTGIRSLRDDIAIGGDCPTEGNHFDSLHKGIDIYKMDNLGKTIIRYNDFFGVQKGVTLNATPMASIIANSFDNVPLDDAYGVYTTGSYGFEIAYNEFATPISSTGLVIKDSYNDAMNGARVIANKFDGGFLSATQFEGNNTNLLLDYNEYTGSPYADWHIATGALADQGECFTDLPALAIRNIWHTDNLFTPTGEFNTFHIINASGNVVTLNHEPGFAPELPASTTNVIVNECFDINSNAPIAGIPVATDEPCIEEQPPTDPGDGVDIVKYQLYLSALIRYHLSQGNRTAAHNLLELENQLWSNKLLTGTHTSEDDAVNALYRLGLVPQDTPKNIDFHNVFNILIADMSNAGNGKASAINTIVELAGQSSHRESLLLAEMALAVLNRNSYEREVLPLPREHQKAMDNPTFVLAPNPTRGQVMIQLLEVSAQNSNLQIYNASGQLVEKIFVASGITRLVYETNLLPTGVYWCKLQTGSQATKSQKLVVIH